MSRRIEIELTSSKDDGSWTWRAAGAKQPKGIVAGGLLPSGVEVGAVLRADVDTGLDGTEVLAVLPPKGGRAEPERIELLGRADPAEWVTTTLAPRGRGRRDDREDRGDRRPRGDRNDRGGARPGGDRGDRGPRRDRPAGDRPAGDRPSGDRRPARADADSRTRRPRADGSPSGPSRPRSPRPAEEARPRPKRLRAGRVHRRAVLDGLPVEHRPVAEQVLKGGIPAVRDAVAKQNEQARAEGKTEVKADQLVDLAERLLPALRTAEWHDRADAALADLDEFDLRDLRSVIVAADTAAKDDETRTLANSLREGLARRVEQEQTTWLAEIASNLAEGRIVRALSLTSRPPKAGAPLPADLSDRLTEAATAALTSETAPSRWATVIDALSFSPVHLKVTPNSIPAEPDEALLAAVKAASSRIPQIAALFGIDPVAPPPDRRRGARPGGGGRPASGKGKSGPKLPPKPALPPKPDGPSAGNQEPETQPAAGGTTTDAPVTPSDESTPPPALDASEPSPSEAESTGTEPSEGVAPVLEAAPAESTAAESTAAESTAAESTAAESTAAESTAAVATLAEAAPEATSSTEVSADPSTEDAVEVPAPDAPSEPAG